MTYHVTSRTFQLSVLQSDLFTPVRLFPPKKYQEPADKGSALCAFFTSKRWQIPPILLWQMVSYSKQLSSHIYLLGCCSLVRLLFQNTYQTWFCPCLQHCKVQKPEPIALQTNIYYGVEDAKHKQRNRSKDSSTRRGIKGGQESHQQKKQVMKI